MPVNGSFAPGAAIRHRLNQIALARSIKSRDSRRERDRSLPQF
jgi:hypothetical protein